jgi:probable chemoreceptor glutamine deamidase cheD
MRVGDRNAAASRKKLSELKIPLLSEDTGENYGRTVIFYPKTGDYVIRAIGKPEKTI